MKNEIPVLIPIKHVSKRCPDKNKILLPYTIRFLKIAGKLENTVVITDSVQLMELALSLNVNAHFEIREPNQDEFLSCWNYLKGKEYLNFYLCPVTQPFRSNDLLFDIEELYNVDKDMIDFVCSLTTIPDRQIYHVQENDSYLSFKKESEFRIGSNCGQHLMIDGALYLVKTEFLYKVINSKNTNRTFWNGRFHGALNTAPFIDIDTKADMSKFEFLHSFFSKNNV